MNIKEIEDLFNKEFVRCKNKWNIERNITTCKDTITNLSKDDSNNKILCKYKNKFFGFDYIAKEFGKDISSTDMIFFDLNKNKIVFVEFKNGKIDKKPKIIKKFIDSFYLLNKILNLEKKNFWELNTCLIFVTNREKNENQSYAKFYTDDMINNLENNSIFYGLNRYKGFFFDEIYTPFCDEFKELMKKKFNIDLIDEED